MKVVFKIAGTDYTSYLVSWSVGFDKEYGSAAASFVLNNDGGRFGKDGANELNLGDTVELIEQYYGDNTQFKKFYGLISQRGIDKSATSRLITVQCLDYISSLQFLDINYIAEADKIEVTDETLTPNYLPSPNSNMAQLFDFAHEAIAATPLPILIIRNKDTDEKDPQYDGFEIYYDVGQMKLGSPLNARYNYDVTANYFFYPEGLYAEDIIESILTLEDGYGNFLFGETSAQAVIDNHLTTDFLTEEASSQDVLTPNLLPTEITIKTAVSTDFDPDVSGVDASVLYVDDTSGFPATGEVNVNGDIFTYSGKTQTSFTGIPTTGAYALKAHLAGSLVKYTYNYPIGQVWYLSYSNLITTLAGGHFTIPGATLQYLDKQTGRIILNTPISLASTVLCNTNYSFKTLQTTGVQLSKIAFRSREVENRFEAINKLREYLAPNYIIRTIGDDKIWASFLSQKTTPDYTLQLATKLNYLEDTDLYTRVLFYVKNRAPTNLIYNDGIAFETTGNDYKATATQLELTVLREEQGHWVYGSSISGVGKIDAKLIQPVVYVNSIPVDNRAHEQILVPVVIESTVRTESTTSSGGK